MRVHLKTFFSEPLSLQLTKSKPTIIKNNEFTIKSLRVSSLQISSLGITAEKRNGAYRLEGTLPTLIGFFRIVVFILFSVVSWILRRTVWPLQCQDLGSGFHKDAIP
jgi:hypothetical protein